MNQREIKFRGKTKQRGLVAPHWITGYYFESEDGRSFILAHKFPDTTTTLKSMAMEVERESVGQYTGLKDKNGVEIYEGDIVRVRHYLDARKFINGEIKYVDSGFVVDVIDIESVLHIVEDIEVIGNIYQNPNLLKND